MPTQAIKDGKGVDEGGVPLWGSWPQSFTDFIYRTGVNSYVHSSNANPTHAGDAAKAPLPVSVSYPAPPGADQQTVTVVVPDAGPGEFVWSVSGASGVGLGATTNQCSYLQATGAITPIDVKDTRAGAPQWSISGQVSDFTGGLSGGHLGWTPTVLTPGAGATAGPSVASVLDGGSGLTIPSLLASAIAGHEPGTARVGADLDLRLPVETTPGTYTAVLTITALS